MAKKTLGLLVLATAGLLTACVGPSSSSPSSTTSSGEPTTSETTTSNPGSSSSSTTSNPGSSSSSTTSETPVEEYLVTVEGTGFTHAFDGEHADGSYEEGDQVTITLTLEASKKLVDVTSEQVTPVVSSEGQETTVTFTMPGEAVTITVTTEDLTFAVSEPTLLGGQAQSQIQSATVQVEEADAVVVRTSVTVKITFKGSIPESNVNQFILYANDVGVRVTPDESTLTTSGSMNLYSAGTATFTMPSADVAIVVTATSNMATDGTTGASVTYEANQYVSFYGTIDSEKYSNVQIYASVKPGYSVTKYQYSANGGETWTDINSVYETTDYTQIMISIDAEVTEIVVKAVGEYLGLGHVSFTNLDSVTITSGISQDSDVTVGETVAISYSAKEGQYISGPATVTGVEPTVNTAGRLEFVMPEEDVTITFALSDNIGLSYSDPDSVITEVHFSTSSWGGWQGYEVESIAPGNSIYVYATPAEGYLLTGISMDNGATWANVTSSYYGDYASFFIPTTQTEDIVFTFRVSEARTVSFQEVEGINKPSDTEYGAGETVSINVSTTSKLYEITGAHIEGDDSIEVTVSTFYGSTSISFTMPDKDVVVVVEVTELESQTITLDPGEEPSSLSSINVRGQTSNNNIYYSPSYAGELSVPFILGETLSTSLSYNITEDMTTVPSLAVVKSDGSTETLVPGDVYPQNYGTLSVSITYQDIKVTEDMTGIKVVYTERQTVTATVNDDAVTTGDITYQINGTEATDLSTLSVGDTLSITAPEAEAGYRYDIAVSGDIVATRTGYYITGANVTITFTKTEVYRITIVDNSNYSAGCYFQDSEGNEIYPTYGQNGRYLDVEKGTVVNVFVYKYSEGGNITVDITSADGTITHNFTNDQLPVQNATEPLVTLTLDQSYTMVIQANY